MRSPAIVENQTGRERERKLNIGTVKSTSEKNLGFDHGLGDN
jgi:hypothetical protein